MNLCVAVKVPAKPDSPPPSTAIVLQSILMVDGGVNVQVQLVGVCGPLMVLVPARLLMVQVKPESSEIVPDALVPATELDDLSVWLPEQVMVTEEPKRLSVHVTPPELLKVREPETALPSALVLPVKVESGHLVLRPLLSSVMFEFVDVAFTAEFTGVIDAWAGTAANASTASAATVRRSADFMISEPFLAYARGRCESYAELLFRMWRAWTPPL